MNTGVAKQVSRPQSSSASTAPLPARASVFPLSFLELLLDGLQVGIANVQPAGAILYCNDRFREILRISPTAKLARTELKRYVSPATWTALTDALAKAMSSTVEGELRIESPGQARIVSIALSPIRLNGATSIRLVATEKTELVEASRALACSQAEIHSLSAKVLRLRDDERRRIARDLHDVTGQEVAFALMTLGSVSNRTGNVQSIRRQLHECSEILRKVESEIRTLSYVLHPPLLDDLGLVAALEWYVQGLEKRLGLRVHLEIRDELPRLARDAEIALFRVVQESLTNVIRHANASNTWIRAEITATRLNLVIEDDGCGVHPDKLSSANRGVGIAGMDQRLRQFGGRLEVTSEGTGTVVCASIPLDGGDANGDIRTSRAESQDPVNTSASLHRDQSAKRILIADDHAVTRRGIRALLEEESDLQVCGEASNGIDALSEVDRLRPDLLILDLSMPRAGGLAVAHRLQNTGSNTKILIFTTHSYPGLERAIQEVGGNGYVLKQNASEELISAVREILGGATHFTGETSLPV